MKKILLPWLMAFFTMFLLSCNKEEVEPLPDNVYVSDSGLKFTLEWETGSGPEKAIEETDLDLFLLIGQDTAGKSAWYDFEKTELKSFYADGFYTLQIDAFKVGKNTRYLLHISHNGSEKVLKSYEGTFKEGDEHSVNFMEIHKNGINYALIPLPVEQE